jgi:hypothetical protein
MAEHADTIVTEPKRLMVSRADHVHLEADVAEWDAAADRFQFTRRVKLADLIGDCFHELGAYTSNCALALDLAPGVGRGAMIAEAIARAQLDENRKFGAVITFPSGISRERRSIYRNAGARFIEGFCGAADLEQEAGTVTLVAEALAAARFGVQEYLSAGGVAAGDAARTFITLDIGAGTYDVTVIDTTVTATGPTKWSVKSHFGLAVGGHDLDGALGDRIARILRRAAQHTEIGSRFEFLPDLPRTRSDLWRIRDAEARSAGVTFLAELQAAKARLTEALRASEQPGYDWPSRSEGGIAFNMCVGIPGNDPAWPVRLASNAPTPPDGTSWSIPGANADLVFERSASGASIRLKVWREEFADRGTPADDRLRDLTKLMGCELPRLAWIEHQRKSAPDQSKAPVWIITGRAALWPPLFEAIAQSIAGFGPHAGHLARLRPFSPQEMKHAVVLGAVQLASEGWPDADYTVYNPIAVITYKLRTSISGDPSASRVIADIVRLHDTPEPRSQKIIETRDPFVVARILPGLDDENGREERLQLFNKLAIEPWVELTREVWSEVRRGSNIRWTVTTRRDVSGLFLAFDPGRGNGEAIVFGPLKEGRIYGAG